MRSKFLYLYLAEFVWRTNVRGKSLKDKFHNILQSSLKASAHSVFKNYDDKSTSQNRKEVLYQ